MVNVRAFRGFVPRTDTRLIGENFAEVALNCRLTAGRIDPIWYPADVDGSGLNGVCRVLFRAVASNAEQAWLAFAERTNVVRSPVADGVDRWYVTDGSHEPRRTTWDDFGTFHTLGLPAPESALSVTVVGGSAASENRAYLYTYRNALGEESGISKAVVASGASDGVWNISGFQAVPDAPDGYAGWDVAGLKYCIYRTTGTDKAFRLVAEIDATQTIFADAVKSVDLGATLESLEAALPPADLHSLVGLPNGCFAGLSGNKLCLSEPYKPHSFPESYRYSFAANGVALSVFANTVLVLTDDYPYLATVTDPAAVSLAQIETYAPCISASGVVDIGTGCIYPSHDGLYLVSSGGVQNLTQNLCKRREWQQFMPDTFRAVVHDNQYFALHDTVTGGAMLILDIAENDSLVRCDYPVECLHSNPHDGVLYCANNGRILAWNSNAGGKLLSFWRSREYQLPYPVNFAIAQVYADWDSYTSGASGEGGDTLTANQALIDTEQTDGAIDDDAIHARALNESAITPLGAGFADSVTFSLLVRGEVKYSVQVKNDLPFRLPAGFKSDVVAFQIASTIPIHSVAMAETVKELKQL